MTETGNKRKKSQEDDNHDSGREEEATKKIALVNDNNNKHDNDDAACCSDKDDDENTSTDKNKNDDVTSSSHSGTTKQQDDNKDYSDLSKRFPFLLKRGDSESMSSFSFGNDKDDESTDFLGLLFAASWCSDCRAVMPTLVDFATVHHDDIHIFYVASDTTKQEMNDFLSSSSSSQSLLSVVPFESQDERANLKWYFGTCALKECESLGMTSEQRKYGIPTLVVLDSKTGQVVTMDGIKDVTNELSIGSAVDKWKAVSAAQQYVNKHNDSLSQK